MNICVEWSRLQIKITFPFKILVQSGLQSNKLCFISSYHIRYYCKPRIERLNRRSVDLKANVNTQQVLQKGIALVRTWTRTMSVSVDPNHWDTHSQWNTATALTPIRVCGYNYKCNLSCWSIFAYLLTTTVSWSISKHF